MLTLILELVLLVEEEDEQARAPHKEGHAAHPRKHPATDILPKDMDACVPVVIVLVGFVDPTC